MIQLASAFTETPTVNRPPQMSSTETTGSPRAQFFAFFLEEYKYKDINRVAQYLHKDHRRITYPKSIGKPDQTKEEYIKHTGEVMNYWADVKASCTYSGAFPANLSPRVPYIPS